MNKLQKRRFATLIRFMEKLPALANRHFNMRHWFDHEGPLAEHAELRGARTLLSRRMLALCGTSACALGWACVVPSLQRAGLRMRLDGDATFNGRLSADGSNLTLARRFFGLSEFDAYDLFCHSRARTPKQWAHEAKKVFNAL